MKKRLRAYLSKVLPSGETKVYNSYDMIGQIAIIRVPFNNSENAKIAAKAIMATHQNVTTVLLQEGPVLGDFRLRSLKHVAGENKKTTLYREHGSLFFVDLGNCYFSPRLSYERMRIASLIKPKETVVNMFSGVGCFSIIIAKMANPAKVFSIDINPHAIHYMQTNIRLNRMYGKVIPLLGDSKKVINSQLLNVADRVLMPLPEKAFAYLNYGVSALKKSGGWIHYYGFEHSNKNENPIEKTKFKVAEKLANTDIAFELQHSRVVRSIGPNWYQIALDIHIKNVPAKS